MTESTRAPRGPLSTLTSIVCFAAIAIPVYVAIAGGAIQLVLSSAEIESEPAPWAVCGSMLLGIALPLCIAIWVVRWRRSDRPREWLQLLVFGAVTLLSLATFGVWAGQPERQHRYLPMHFAADAMFDRETKKLPIGGLVCFAGPEASIPPGFVVAEGQTLERTEYPAFFAAVGATDRPEDSAWRLPDLSRMANRRGDDESSRWDDQLVLQRSQTNAITEPVLWLVKVE